MLISRTGKTQDNLTVNLDLEEEITINIKGIQLIIKHNDIGASIDGYDNSDGEPEVMDNTPLQIFFDDLKNPNHE